MRFPIFSPPNSQTIGHEMKSWNKNLKSDGFSISREAQNIPIPAANSNDSAFLFYFSD